jgi:branched-chain amino acid transport system substrate-binding protein
MVMLKVRVALSCVAVLLLGLTGAHAEGTIKIGIIAPYSGQFADTGVQMDNGIKLFMQQHGDKVAGKTIEIIRKDVGGIAPDVAKRLAQELIVRDKVDLLTGFILTPNAMAAGDVSAQAKKFMVVMNAATSVIIDKSPYMVRTSVTTPQINETYGAWVFKHGTKKVYTMVSDYGPGHDAEQAFHRGFKAAGGEIVGADRFPVANPDFSAFVQRAKNANPEAIYIWLPGGTQPAAIAKALAERGINPSNTKIFGQGELTLPEALKSMGDSAIGMITAFHYDYNHQSATNKEFVSSFEKMFNRIPDIYAVGAYDGMHVIYGALDKTKGNTDGEALVAAAKGMAWESPRGPISIDPETRDIINTIYIRKVEKVDGKLVNVEFDKVEKVKDPTHGKK